MHNGMYSVKLDYTVSFAKRGTVLLLGQPLCPLRVLLCKQFVACLHRAEVFGFWSRVSREDKMSVRYTTPWRNSVGCHCLTQEVWNPLSGDIWIVQVTLWSSVSDPNRKHLVKKFYRNRIKLLFALVHFRHVACDAIVRPQHRHTHRTSVPIM
jgi:hypothetical protein